MKRYDIYASTHHTTSWGEPCVVAELDIKECEQGEWVKHSELPEIQLPEVEWLGDSWSGGWAILKENLIEALEEQGFKVKK